MFKKIIRLWGSAPRDVDLDKICGEPRDEFSSFREFSHHYMFKKIIRLWGTA